MQHMFALVAALASLGLAGALYYSNVVARPGSWPRGDMPAMVLVALLSGLFPSAAVAALVGLWAVFGGGQADGAVLAGGVDLLALGIVVVTLLVLRATVRGSRRVTQAPSDATPPKPRPVASGQAPRPMKKAA